MTLYIEIYLAKLFQRSETGCTEQGLVAGHCCCWGGSIEADATGKGWARALSLLSLTTLLQCRAHFLAQLIAVWVVCGWIEYRNINNIIIT